MIPHVKTKDNEFLYVLPEVLECFSLKSGQIVYELELSKVIEFQAYSLSMLNVNNSNHRQ